LESLGGADGHGCDYDNVRLSIGDHMFTRRLSMVTFAILTSSACNPFHRAPAVTVSAENATLNTSWHANLASPATLAGAVQMNGSVSMAPGANRGSTDVTLNLANASPGGLHPWGVHTGQCGPGMDGGVLGPSDAYKQLKVESDGRANRTVTIGVQTPTSGSYFVVVFASVGNAETVVACGNFAPPTS
jgi:hypothetical protein